MPIAMNLNFIKDRTYSDKLENLNDMNFKLPKTPLSNGTNRPDVVMNAKDLKSRLVSPSTINSSSRLNRRINLEQLNRSQSKTKIDLTDEENHCWLALACSTDYILVGGGSSSRLHLYDYQGKLVRSVNINTFAAFDLAWSSVLNGFLIAGYDQLQLYNVETDELKQIEHLDLINKKDNYFWSICCHETDLFVVLSDGLESVWRISLPDFKRRQTLSGSEIRESNIDDRISCIRTNGLSIAMSLRQRRTQQWRVDLFDYTTMTRTHRGLSIGQGIGSFNFQERAMLTPVDDHQWLIIGGENFKPNTITSMDDQTGQIKQVLRSEDCQDEFLGNIAISDYRNSSSQMIVLVLIDKKTQQRQIHIYQQDQFVSFT